MGMFFSNLHFRKNENVTMDAVREAMVKSMTDAGYVLTEEGEDCDRLFLRELDGDWISVCGDMIEFGNAEQVKKTAQPLSEALSTDVLAMGCFDSDYLFMNLVNAAENVDLWANVGTNTDGPALRRSNIPKWKTKIGDHKTFAAAFKREHIFAEEVLGELEPVLKLPFEQACLCCDDGFDAEVLCFRRPAVTEKPPLPKLEFLFEEVLPCRMGERNVFSVVNRGEASRGLLIAFSGDYVEHDEITFEDVQIAYKPDGFKWKEIPLTLTKMPCPDGSFIFCAAALNFELPPMVPQDLSVIRRLHLEADRAICLRFTPVGDPAKASHITVNFMPLASPVEGGCAWNVEQHSQFWR